MFVFIVSLPFLYLYATGYRFSLLKPTNIVSTGGMYVAVDRTGAEIYIDGELVRETRTFRKAFYAQSLDIGTHRIHVQKEGYHTWVKELPVSKRLVTEAQAFNLPLVPEVRVISAWKSATGTTIVKEFTSHASSTNELIATTTKQTKQFLADPEYNALLVHFATTSSSTDTETRGQQIKELILGEATTTGQTVEVDIATSTLVSGGVKLFRNGTDVSATWIGLFEQMPYYYCAPDFPRYSTTSSSTAVDETLDDTAVIEPLPVIDSEAETVMHPVQTIPENTVCDPTINIDHKWQNVRDFHFFPGSTDFVILTLEDGVYVAEIDDRAWQNKQPLFMGEGMRTHIENGTIYVYDGTYIYQIIIKTE
jgi:ribosome-associated protein YbcJ (S4-like RNA binding protein)